MELPVYTMEMFLAQPAIDWSTALAHDYGVHPSVVVNALLLYAMYEITTHEAEGMATLDEFIATMQTSTPAPATLTADHDARVDGGGLRSTRSVDRPPHADSRAAPLAATSPAPGRGPGGAALYT